VSKIGSYVKFTAQPGQGAALVAQLLIAAQLAQAAPGCEVYIINTSPTEADVVWVTEIWQSQAAHDASLANDDARAHISRVLPLLAGRPEQIHLVPVGGKGLTLPD
jgi:quinol monooxygenase YgiN